MGPIRVQEEPQAKKCRMEVHRDVEGGAVEIEVTLPEDNDAPCTSMGDSGWVSPDFKPPPPNIPPFTASPGVNIHTQNFQVVDFFPCVCNMRHSGRDAFRSLPLC